MTIQERKKRIRNKKRKQVVKRKMFFLLVAIFVITVGSIAFGSVFSTAKNPASDVEQYKYYKSIEIQSGDSLWSIAEEYCTDDYEDAREYVAELKELNGLTSDTIHAGQHLVVAYYDTEIH